MLTASTSDGRRRVIIPLQVERAALAMGLDVATAEVVAALADRGVRTVTLKGPAVAYWLYRSDPAERTYRDVDIAVDPLDFEKAEDVLRSLDFTCPTAGIAAREKAWMMETPWERPGSPPISIDLHRGFHGVDDWSAWWTMLDGNAVSYPAAGPAARIVDAAACAVVVTLHDTAVDRGTQSAEDEDRALRLFDATTWADAAQRAADVGALPSFVLGLSRHAAGRALIRKLQLHPPLPFPLAVVARAAARPGADSLAVGRAHVVAQRLAQDTEWQGRARALWTLIFPSAGFLRMTRPLARRGRLGLIAARVRRPIELATYAPSVLYHLWRGLRRGRYPYRGEGSEVTPEPQRSQPASERDR